MLSLEVQISKHTNRWVDVTNDFLNITSRNYLSGRKHWRTMKGVENFIDKAIKTYPWLTREKWRWVPMIVEEPSESGRFLETETARTHHQYKLDSRNPLRLFESILADNKVKVTDR